ncbi:hypothetical protein GUJ93_ZPchr0013g37715 [Zizania palustris]|uniref:Uncharacterized protein n=1 Tax=Zizania palustris TaxID=103762 RepID=A0A8J5WUT8_ZIZPA|nr:hypothetical protein GUJ93_ZPchr0013g37715 [Zizania palustris]
MASRLVAAAASSSSSSSPLARLISRRRLAGAADHHGPVKVNLWQDPMHPGNWKEEHFVLASLAGWGAVIYGASKLFGGKKENKTEVAPAPAQ